MSPRKSEAEWEARPARDTDTVSVLLIAVIQTPRASKLNARRAGRCH
jgi:hypothetical protein